MNGIELIKKEREEQLKKHGWTSEHDDTHKKHEYRKTIKDLLNT